jgi:hypothetical protein
MTSPEKVAPAMIRFIGVTVVNSCFTGFHAGSTNKSRDHAILSSVGIEENGN